MKRRLLWQIYPAVLVTTVLGLLAISWTVKGLVRTSFENENILSLERLANLSIPSFSPLLEKKDLAGIQNACNRMSAAAQVRFTVIDINGKVLGESDKPPVEMLNHFDRREFQQALRGNTGHRIRSSDTLQREMIYVAVPIKKDGDIIAVLRTSVAMERLHTTQHLIFIKIFHYGCMIAIVLAILSLVTSWKISRPLAILRQGAERFAQGDLNHRLPVSKTRDIGELALSMNEMAAQLDDRIHAVMAQKNEQQAVLESMIEGVIAVSIDGNILSINHAAAEILQTTEKDAVGRTVEEVFRNKDLLQFVQHAAEYDEPAEKQVVMHINHGNERYLQVHETPLQDDQNNKIGVLIVLNDVTHIHRLEKVRKDFVANVSHELKTPVTSIKGFIETLLDGAVDKPEDSQRFLKIIARQTNRLNSIIDDLLVLSRIEQQGQQEYPDLKPVYIKPILSAAASLCRPAATEKNIAIELDCPESLQARVNASLLEQAVVNLVDNSIKYSDPENDIRLEVLQDTEGTTIHVHDHGCGIAAEDVPRVFERFYRVDKARSRKLGGTGLGLAIVKHIAQFHKGSVTVESTFGRGSTFSLHLPE